MKNLIVVGDSFCASRNVNNDNLNHPSCWPNLLAQELKLNLLGEGIGGAGWWPTRQSLRKLTPEQINNTECMVFCHSDANRLLNHNLNQNHLDKHDPNPANEEHLAVKLYYKYILDMEFANWAQQMWLREISDTYGHLKLIHLHCFPWSVEKLTISPTEVSVSPALASVSLNEFELGLFDSKNTIVEKLRHDTRHNHLSEFNNMELARQLAEIIRNYSVKNAILDVGKFQTKSIKWFDIDFWDIK